jgi:hypothetical protein
MMMAMRVLGEEEGKGGKAMAMATRAAGELTATLMKSAVATKTREVGKEEGIGRGGKSNSDGKEDGNCKQRQQQPQQRQ